jgi:hypothetical protein
MKKKQYNRKESLRFSQTKKVMEMMRTGRIKNIEGIFVEGATTRILAGTIYTHKDFKLDSQISF